MYSSQEWWSAAESGELEHSLRFRTNGNTPQLVRNVDPATTGALTVSFWIKFTEAAADHHKLIFRGNQSPSSCIQWQGGTPSAATMRLICNSVSVYSQSVYRDTNAWYHVVISTNGTNKTRLYFNNRLDVESDEVFSLGGRMGWGNPHPDAGLNTGNVNNYWQGYLAECHIVDGQELAPANFAEYDDNGVWIPKKVAIGDYGVNGCHLDFSDPNNIGADRSGNGNNFTPTGFLLDDPSSVAYDYTNDNPTWNFATFNAVQVPPRTSLDYANLRSSALGTESSVSPNGTVHVPVDGKVYIEYRCIAVAEGGNYPRFGFSKLKTSTSNQFTTGDWALDPTGGIISAVGQPTGHSFTDGDWVAIAYDRQANQAWIAVNDSVDISQPPILLETEFGDDEVVFACINSARGTNNSRGVINFGQLPNQFDIPEGFQFYSSAATLDEAPIPNGRDHFRLIVAPGADILGLAQGASTGFENGMWWFKSRSLTVNESHQIVDSLRGNNAWVPDMVNDPPQPQATFFNPSDTADAVAWCWNCPETFTPTGTQGTSYTGRRNRAAGMGMVQFNGPAAGPFTFTHGLDSPPDFMIHTGIDIGTNRNTYNRAVGNDRSSPLNVSQTSPIIGTEFWNNTDPDSTNITIGTISNQNATYQVYYWHSVPGYSQFGTYEGNGEDLDGPFIYTGFTPTFVIFRNLLDSRGKKTNTNLQSGGALSPDNPCRTDFPISIGQGDSDSGSLQIDFLSNGFKIRANPVGVDSNDVAGTPFYYACWGQNPFGGSNVSPANAR